MNFYLVGFTFWLLIGVSVLLFVWGLWKKSWKTLLISGFTTIPPTLYFSGAENWFKVLALLPLLLFFLAYYTRKKVVS